MPNLLQLAGGERIRSPYWCMACKGRASVFTANERIIELRPEAGACDYWAACDNTECKNAYGDERDPQNSEPAWLLSKPPAT